jgi:hypothetical protein
MLSSISELFNIIVEHPACKGALEDLKVSNCTVY